MPSIVPVDSEVITIQATSAAAVQSHAEVVVISAVNVPPPLGTDCTAGDNTYEHEGPGVTGEELGVTGDELCPQPVVNASSSMPTPYRIFIDNLIANLP